MQEFQQTVKAPVTFKGKGLHTGLMVEMSVCPADANHGIKFQRTDVEGMPVIPALADYVTDTSRGTTLTYNNVSVSTIEHLMGALFGLGIDNALIKINAPETPILDGSAKLYVEKLRNNIEPQEEQRVYFEVKEKIVVKTEQKNSEITIYPSNTFGITVHVDFGSKVLGHQYATVGSVPEIVTEIADSRTFVFFHELELLRKNNLIKGGDVDNAIVIVEDEVKPEDIARIADIFNKPRVERMSSGYLNNIDLRSDNEPARHKLLDLAGDLYLAGMPIKGNVVAYRPGHLTNTILAKELRKLIKKAGEQAPVYDPNMPPLLDINEIKKRLPHRPPFLLVDKILTMDATTVVGVKNVTMNEPFFVGHFPEEPVMPGVLIVEAMAQCGGILALSSVPDPENYSTYFLKIDGVKFKRKIVPGDTLVFKLSLVEPIRRGLVHMQAQAFVGNTLATESDLLAQVVKNKNVA
ncbi:3-hydroxyacyl-[acyl-carrier-protein] dehydratase FabZ [Bacteroidia bacterium]|nr:3-hydroxyacyl-[acyl-carrier-protein] dehydratase FabZ [Bacteroidia bacterium]